LDKTITQPKNIFPINHLKQTTNKTHQNFIKNNADEWKNQYTDETKEIAKNITNKVTFQVEY
jgi:hypothetical protein